MAEIVLGAGRIYFELENSSGVLSGGERYLSETPGFGVSLSATSLEDWTSDGKTAEKQLEITTKVDRAGKLTLKDALLDNMAIFVAGTVSTVTQVATPVVDEAVTGYKDRWIQLGRSLSNPTGVRNVSAVNISKASAPSTPLSAVTDYELDAALGRFRPLTAGTIIDGDALLIDYTPAAESRQRIASDQLGPRVGALHFIADNTAGPNKDVYIPKVQLTPTGDLEFKSRDTVMLMSFDLKMSIRPGYAQMYIDGRAV